MTRRLFSVLVAVPFLFVGCARVSVEPVAGNEAEPASATLSTDQLAALADHHEDNVRPLQEINDRTILRSSR
jgi:hypothetical protein